MEVADYSLCRKLVQDLGKGPRANVEGEKGVMAVAKTTVVAETPALKFLLAMKTARWEMDR